MSNWLHQVLIRRTALGLLDSWRVGLLACFEDGAVTWTRSQEFGEDFVRITRLGWWTEAQIPRDVWIFGCVREW